MISVTTATRNPDLELGFTLLEVLIAAVTIAVSVTAVFAAMNAIEVTNHRARNLTIATQVAQQQMEVYRNTPFSGLPANGTVVDFSASLNPYPSLTAPRTATATFTDVAAGSLKQVDIALSYTESGHLRKVQVTTQIAARGLNK